MDRDQEAMDIYQRPIDQQEKIRLLKDLLLDINNELEAQDQNMHPEIHHRLSEGLRLVKNFLRELSAEPRP